MERVKGLAKDLLNKSEKYTKTDMTYVAKGSFWLMSGQIISLLVTVLLSISFANLIAPETYGTYRFVISVASILLVTNLNGINNTLSQAVSRGFEGDLINGVRIKKVWGIWGLVGGFILSAYYFFNANYVLSGSFALIALFIPTFETFTLYEVYLQGKKDFKYSTKYSSISRVVSALVMIISLLLTNNLFVILLAYFLPWTILRYTFYKITLKKFPPNKETDSTTISYGKHLSLIGIAGQVSNYLDQILLFHFLGPIQVAIYSFAFAPIDQIRATYKNIPLLAMPKLSNRSIEEISHLFWERFWKLLGIGVLIAIAYSLAAPYIFKIFFPQYLESVFYTIALSGVLVLRLPFVFVNAVVQSKLNETPKSWLYYRSINPFVLILSLLILTPLFGIMGVVISRIIFVACSLTIILIQWSWFKKGKHLAK